MKKRKVVVIGGGVAGLSAAHELVERDFDVSVYERNRILGGKARSIDVEETVTGRRQALPGEHGFRFFPGWYRHLPDTMSRIPYPKSGKNVKKNLVRAQLNLLASYDRDPIEAVVEFPVTWERLKLAFKLPQEVAEIIPADDIEFFLRKMSQFVVSCEDRRRAEVEPQSWWEFMEADSRSREFQLYLVKGATQSSVAARAETASAYTIAKLVVQTFLDVVVPGGASDSVLNGPTQEVWIDPWRKYLEEQGVEFKLGWEFDDFEWSPRQEISGARFSPVEDELKLAQTKCKTLEFLDNVAAVTVKAQPTPLDWLQLSQAAASIADLQLSAADTKRFAPLGETLERICMNLGKLRAAELVSVRNTAQNLHNELLKEYAKSEKRLAEVPRRLRELHPEWFKQSAELNELAKKKQSRTPTEVDRDEEEEKTGLLDSVSELTENGELAAPLRLFEQLDLAAVQATTTLPLTPLSVLRAALTGLERKCRNYETARADYFVLALPVEQAAYYVNRSAMLTKKDPKLADLVRLSEHVEWMAGIQFFLTERVNVTPGHIDCLDSEWALTAISPVQFWDDIDMKERGDGTCKSILSVDISSWYTLGNLHPKAAWDCTVQEIAEEVWDQLKRSLNRTAQSPVLTDSQLHGGKLVHNKSFFLDDSIIERYDRKKQGLLEKFRRVAFDGGALTDRQFETKRAADAPQAFGSRAAINAEPLLVNRAGALALRPEAKTLVRNLFLASDYVATTTNLACMEGANEAARMAVNAILIASGFKKDPCEIWPPEEPLGALRLLDQQLFERGQRLDVLTDLPFRVAGATGKAASEVASKAWRFFKDRL